MRLIDNFRLTKNYKLAYNRHKNLDSKESGQLVRYKKPTRKDFLVSSIISVIFGIILSTAIFIFLGPIGIIIGPIFGLFFGFGKRG